MTINLLMYILYAIAGLMAFLLLVLCIVYFNMKTKEQKEIKKEKEKTGKKENKNEGFKQFSVGSVFDFMEFDKIEDNMIVEKNGTKYLMVIECQGINYDLMSEAEKVSVEEGFIQFLNTLSGPVQLYIQTRTINLANSIQNYKKQVSEVQNSYTKQKIKYEQLLNSGNAPEEELKKEYYELIKQKNLSEYGNDIIYNTEKMSLNKNILTKKYYAVISYYTYELGGTNLDKFEIKDRAFSELYTKAQAIIRALAISGVVGKILSSTDLIDLLYVAYNRDDAEIYGIDKAMSARYDELYSTAQDYMEKKIKILDNEIEKQAYQKANQTVSAAQSELEKQYTEKKETMDDIINNLAALIIEENAETLGTETADIAKEKLEKEREEKDKNVQKKETRRVANSTK